MARKEEIKTEKIIFKKAFEIAYVLCRLAQVLKNKNFSNNFEDQALKILNFSIQKNFDDLKISLLNLEYFIHLAVELNILKINLAEILLDEINGLNKYIIEAEEEILLSQSEIENIFKNGNNKKSKIKLTKKEFINGQLKDSAMLQNLENNPLMDLAITKDSANNPKVNSAIDSAKISGSAIDFDDSAIDPNIEIDSAIDSAKEPINDLFFNDFSVNNSLAIDSAKEEIGSAIRQDLANSSAKILDSAIDLAIEDSANIKDSAIDPEIENSSAMNSAMGSAKDSAIEKNLLTTSGFKHISEIIKEEPSPHAVEEKEEPSSIKKSIFLERINHFNEFKLKDIEKIFPDLSPRTIRYYLSELVSLGFIEKIGISGPNVVYKVKK